MGVPGGPSLRSIDPAAPASALVQLQVGQGAELVGRGLGLPSSTGPAVEQPALDELPSVPVDEVLRDSPSAAGPLVPSPTIEVAVPPLDELLADIAREAAPRPEGMAHRAPLVFQALGLPLEVKRSVRELADFVRLSRPSTRDFTLTTEGGQVVAIQPTDPGKKIDAVRAPRMVFVDAADDTTAIAVDALPASFPSLVMLARTARPRQSLQGGAGALASPVAEPSTPLALASVMRTLDPEIAKGIISSGPVLQRLVALTSVLENPAGTADTDDTVSAVDAATLLDWAGGQDNDELINATVALLQRKAFVTVAQARRFVGATPTDVTPATLWAEQHHVQFSPAQTNLLAQAVLRLTQYRPVLAPDLKMSVRMLSAQFGLADVTPGSTLDRAFESFLTENLRLPRPLLLRFVSDLAATYARELALMQGAQRQAVEQTRTGFDEVGLAGDSGGPLVTRPSASPDARDAGAGEQPAGEG